MSKTILIWLTLIAFIGQVQLGLTGTCEDIQDLMDNTVREDCSSRLEKVRGGQICVPQSAGPLLLFHRGSGSPAYAMRSYSETGPGSVKDESLLIGYYPKWDKCFLITRTVCHIKGTTIEPNESRVYWIEICPANSVDTNDETNNIASLHRVNLDGSGHLTSTFEVPLENWFNIGLDVDSIGKKLYVITYKETLECDLNGSRCISLERPSEGTLLASRVD